MGSRASDKQIVAGETPPQLRLSPDFCKDRHVAADQFVVSYSSQRAYQRARKLGAAVRSRVIGLLITAAVCGGIWWWRKDDMTTENVYWMFDMTTENVYWMFGVALGISVVLIAITTIRWALAKRELSNIGIGPAFVMVRQGIMLPQGRVAWPEVTEIGLRTRFGKAFPSFYVAGLGLPRWETSTGNLDVLPGTIDAAVRALSNGEASLDLTKLDD